MASGLIVPCSAHVVPVASVHSTVCSPQLVHDVAQTSQHTTRNPLGAGPEVSRVHSITRQEPTLWRRQQASCFALVPLKGRYGRPEVPTQHDFCR